MWVEQRLKQPFFDGISSKLRMCETSAIGMLFEVFLCQIQQLKRMTIISNAIKHYQFGSCLRTYLLACRPIQYPKTAQKALRDAYASCKQTRRGKRCTTSSIAACSRKKGISGLFDRKRAFYTSKKLQNDRAIKNPIFQTASRTGGNSNTSLEFCS